MTDSILLRHFREGDETAGNRLTEKYYPDVLRFCVYRTGHIHDSDDLAQETFLRLFKSLESYRETQQFKSYLFVIAANVCNDYLRGRQQDITLTEEVLPDSDVWEPETRETHIVREAIASLPPDQRETVVLYYYGGLRLRQIARYRGEPINTVKTRLCRGREKLKTYLIKEGLS